MGVLGVRETFYSLQIRIGMKGWGVRAMSCIAMIWWSMADAIISVQFSTIPFNLCGDCISCVCCMYPRTVAHTLYTHRQHQKISKIQYENKYQRIPSEARTIYIYVLLVSDCAIYIFIELCPLLMDYYYVLRRWWETIRPIHLFIYYNNLPPECNEPIKPKHHITHQLNHIQMESPHIT